MTLFSSTISGSPVYSLRSEPAASTLLPIPVPPLRRLTFGKRPKSKQKVLPLAFGPTSSGSLAPSLLQGHAAKGHPWPIASLAASMPLNPLHNDSTRPPDGAFGVVWEIGAPTVIVPTLCVGTPSEDAPRPALDLWQRFVDVLDLALIDAERRELRSHAERGNDHHRQFRRRGFRIPSGDRNLAKRSNSRRLARRASEASQVTRRKGENGRKGLHRK